MERLVRTTDKRGTQIATSVVEEDWLSSGSERKMASQKSNQA
jgi:hypothetical protein